MPPPWKVLPSLEIFLATPLAFSNQIPETSLEFGKSLICLLQPVSCVMALPSSLDFNGCYFIFLELLKCTFLPIRKYIRSVFFANQTDNFQQNGQNHLKNFPLFPNKFTNYNTADPALRNPVTRPAIHK